MILILVQNPVLLEATLSKLGRFLNNSSIFLQTSPCLRLKSVLPPTSVLRYFRVTSGVLRAR